MKAGMKTKKNGDDNRNCRRRGNRDREREKNTEIDFEDVA